jgi:hypothetical protein
MGNSRVLSCLLTSHLSSISLPAFSQAVVMTVVNLPVPSSDFQYGLRTRIKASTRGRKISL